MTPPFAAVVAVGPGDGELARLADLLDGLFAWEPPAVLVVVDDGWPPRGLAARLAVPAGCELVCVPNPRRGRGIGWRGGLVTSTLEGLRLAAERPDVAFAVKLDTDSLVIGRFAARVAAFLAARPEVGVVGSYAEVDTAGRPVGPSTWAVNLERLLRPVKLRRYPYPHVQLGFVGRTARIRRVIRAAQQYPWYRLGACCQGGGYAVSAAALARLTAGGLLADPRLWLYTELTEDVVASLYVAAVGLRAADDNGPGGVFGVRFVGLPAGPADLAALGYAIIHSVKSADGADEAATRAYFRDRRPGRPT